MTIFLALFLGLVQGIAEFLPISSSGHLAIFQNLFGLKDVPMLFDVLLHFGTLVALCAFYRKDILEMLREAVRFVTDPTGKKQKPTPARRLLLLIILACLPLVPFVLLKDSVESLMGMPVFIGAALCVTGLLLFVSDRAKKGKKNEKNAKLTDALFVGVAQGVALIPGLSRSGTTIAAGLFRGFDRGFAVRFSFLLSLPAVLAATVLELFDSLKPAAEGAAETAVALEFFPCFLGMLTAAVVGYVSIGLVKKLVQSDKFGGFAYYCFTVGIITIVASLILGK